MLMSVRLGVKQMHMMTDDEMKECMERMKP